MKRVFALLAPILDVDEGELALNTTSDDLDVWDSLATINLAVALELEFELSLSADDLEALTSMRAISEVLQKHGVVLVD